MPVDRELDVGVKPQSVLITGGGSGIGAALAIELAGRECQVLISGRREGALDAVAASSERISVCAGDITDESHRSALVQAFGRLPGPRAVFHGAGYFQTGLLDRLSSTEWRRSFATNVEARWALSCECGPLLVGGRILFIGSDAGATPRPGAAAYSVAQAASETLRRALQAEWEHRSVSVGAFKPGLVDTDMVRGFMRLSQEEFPARAAYEEYFDSGAVSTADTIARFAAWLLLEVSPERFVETEWDVRHPGPRTEWSEGQ